MAWRLKHSAGPLTSSGARAKAKTCQIRSYTRCAVEVPLRRPDTPQYAKAKITRQQLLSIIAARTATPRLQTDGTPSRETVELDVLIRVLPARVRAVLERHIALPQLVEVVLDLGRPVVARFPEGAQLLSRDPLTQQELEEVTSKART